LSYTLRAWDDQKQLELQYCYRNIDYNPDSIRKVLPHRPGYLL